MSMKKKKEAQKTSERPIGHVLGNVDSTYKAVNAS